MPTTASIKLVSAKGVPVFKLGKQVDSNGVAKHWTPEQIDEAIAAYNEVAAKADHEAPVLHGHRGKHAFGWIERAYRVGETLFCDLKNVVESFAQNVNSKLHPKRSISFYPPDHPNNPTPGRLNINHLAYLPAEGEINPAVKGLADHSFSEEELDRCIEYEFTEASFGAWMGMSPLDAAATLFQSLRDKTIEDEGVEAAEALYPQAAIDSIKSSATQQWATVDMVFNAIRPLQMQVDSMFERSMAGAEQYADMTTETTDSNMSDTSNPEVSLEQFSELQSTVKTLQAELTATREQATATAEENKQLKAERERDLVNSFVESLVQQRKLRPTEKESKVKLLLSMPNDNSFEFAEGVTKSSRQALMDDLASAKELYSVKDMPTGPEHDPTSFSEQMEYAGLEGLNVDRESVKQDQMIRRKQAEMTQATGRPVEYAEAMTALGITY